MPTLRKAWESPLGDTGKPVRPHIQRGLDWGVFGRWGGGGGGIIQFAQSPQLLGFPLGGHSCSLCLPKSHEAGKILGPGPSYKHQLPSLRCSVKMLNSKRAPGDQGLHLLPASSFQRHHPLCLQCISWLGSWPRRL